MKKIKTYYKGKFDFIILKKHEKKIKELLLKIISIKEGDNS